MCACDPGYSGDGFNCTGIHSILFINDAVYLHNL